MLKSATTQDYSKIIDVTIENEEITTIDKDNEEIKKLALSLRKLNLSHNFLTTISNVD